MAGKGRHASLHGNQIDHGRLVQVSSNKCLPLSLPSLVRYLPTLAPFPCVGESFFLSSSILSSLMSSEAPVVAVPAEEVKAAEPAVEAPAAAEPVAVSSTLLLRWRKSISEFCLFF